MARSKKSAGAGKNVSDYRHEDAKRKNNPPAGLAAHGRVPRAEKLRYAYDPHLPPVLRFDPTGRADYLDELIGRAIGGTLSEEDGALLRELLGSGQPWLEWTGKREAQEFVVDPVALHVHERVSTQAILSVLRREDVQRDLFADPQQPLHEAVRFYEHDVDWANRLILGDSLQVMASLARREGLAGKVQMIYMDPPYGIKFSSNFQPEIGRRDVKDRDQDLTREPETVKAYRDTWTLGIHSYLSYLRDRLILCRELLADSGSIFVQISDENLHRVRCVMDEVFGPENFAGLISFSATTGQTSSRLAQICDYLLWYARDLSRIKFRPLYTIRKSIENPRERYVCVETPVGEIIDLSVAQKAGRAPIPEGEILKLQDTTSRTGSESSRQPFEAFGRVYTPKGGRGWSTSLEGLERLRKAEQLVPRGNHLWWKAYRTHGRLRPLTSMWLDTRSNAFSDPKIFVVQTPASVIQRCILMTTDPGDLVLDPTCGSGTTAYIAEQWGRRWITIDTSRVAIALARQRLMTATFPHYVVKGDDASDGRANPARGFKYKTVPYITLKSIAKNVALDPILEKHQKVLEERLADLNRALGYLTPELRARLRQKLLEKAKTQGRRAITESDRRRWLLPETEWREWEVPFDTDPDWPEPLRVALVAYRQAWRAKMDEVNAAIAAGAEQVELVDQPEVEKGVVRVSGPFTVEAVMPIELSDGGEPGFAGAPEGELDTFDASEVVNAEAFVDKIVRLLVQDGVRFPDNHTMKFTRLQRIEGSVALHAEGEWTNGEGGVRHVVVSIGPEHGPVTAYQVEEALREAYRRGADDIVFAGFSFDGAAQAAIQDDPHPRVRAHLAHIAPDVQMGDLLKTTPNSQLFSVFGLPRAELRRVPGSEDEWVVEMQGVDIYDPVTNTIHPTRADKVAAWFLDSDYDGRTFCITQAFFPDHNAWRKLERALRGTIDPDRWEMLTGTVSLPFKPSNHRRVAVKVIDPRGNEVMRVIRVAE